MPDLNPSKWKLLTKVIAPPADGWVRTTKVLEIEDVGCLVNFTVARVDSTFFSETLEFVPGVKFVVVDDIPDLVAIT